MAHNVAQAFARAVTAWRNCQRTGNETLADRWYQYLHRLADLLPSGSGFDSGTTFDEDSSTDSRLVFRTSFHHMNDGGMYDGWTDHTVTVRPAFTGLDIKVSGRNRNDIKDYIGDAFAEILNQEAPYR